jgi:hypothetical protein
MAKDIKVNTGFLILGLFSLFTFFIGYYINEINIVGVGYFLLISIAIPTIFERK